MRLTVRSLPGASSSRPEPSRTSPWRSGETCLPPAFQHHSTKQHVVILSEAESSAQSAPPAKEPSAPLSRKPHGAKAGPRNFLRIIAAIILGIGATLRTHAAENTPVKSVAPTTLAIGATEARLYISEDWTKPQPQITTALLIFHGKQRNAKDYFRTGLAATPGSLKSSTIVIAPQFLEQVDIDEHHLPANTLRWNPTAWSGGEDAIAPTSISSYQVIDSALLKLTDRKLFPNLKTVIIAGHSAGGQVVSRYAAIGKGPVALEHAGYNVHIVIANPSSWLYFSPERPDGKGNFTRPHKTCNGEYDVWKYGLNDLPAYAARSTPEGIEARFMALDITVLLGTADNDPNHPVLDKSCPAELQGAYRLQRGENYFSYILKRHPETHFRLMEVDGIGHDGDAMFQSACGQFSLFNTGACDHIVH